MRRLAGVFGCAALAALLCEPRARAQNTVDDITVDNQTAAGEPVCIGDNTVYTAVIRGNDYLGGVKWYYQWTGCAPDKPEVQWLDTNGQPLGGVSVNTQEQKIGTFTLRASATFSKPPPDSGTYTVDKTVTFSVLPPDKVQLANPAGVLDVNVPTVPPGPGAAPSFRVAFNVMKGTRVLNWGGTALEQLNRSKYGLAPDLPLGPQQYLSATVGAIIDLKGVLGDAGFAAQAPGAVLDEFDQTLGLRLPTGCGSTQDITLTPAFHFQMIKVDGGNWKLHQP